MTTPALEPASSYGREWSFRQRAAAFVISVLINLLILWILLTLAPRIQGTPGAGKGALTTFNVSNDNKPKSGEKSAAAAPKQVSASRAKSAVPKPIVQLPILSKNQTYTPFIELSQDDFHKTDISKMPSHPEEASAAASSSSAGGSGAPGDSTLAGGSGPNGEPLYNAEWYRHPTDAEMNGYMPKRNIPEGAWAEIACKTMPRFHVDECVELGDSPPGYGIGRAIQQAGWQFLVRPPRVGGKTLVGSWVRIHIDFYQKRGSSEQP